MMYFPMRFTMRILFAAALFSTSAPELAQSAFEDLDQLDNRVAATIADTGGGVSPIDRRLHLARCPVPATIDAPTMGAVAVRCAPLGWKIRVRIEGAAQQTDIRIRRGDTVSLAVNGHGFQLRTTAVAVEDGTQGGIVHVKSSTGTVTLAARVTGIGQAEIDD
jgi:flagellar basal body P-ring formation protein FlgA